MKVIIIEEDLITADHLRILLNSHSLNVVQIIDNVKDATEYLSDKLNKAFLYLTVNNDLPATKNADQTKPSSFINKAYKESDIIDILEIFKSNINETINVKTTFGKKKIELSKILYIKANGTYSQLVTSKKTYIERISLNQYEEELNSNFIRVHRSYIINKHQIDQFNSSFVYINNVKIPISRSYKGNFKSILE